MKPVITILGQDYTVDVQSGLVRNVLYPAEVFTFDRFQDMVADAAEVAEAEGNHARLAEVQSIQAAFVRIIAAGIRHAENPIKRSNEFTGDNTETEPVRRTRRRDRNR